METRDAAKPIFRGSHYRRAECACGGREDGRSVPEAGDQRCIFLNLEVEVGKLMANDHLLPTLATARRIIQAWRTDDNRVRPHSSLSGLAPGEFTNRPRHGRVDTEANLQAA
jgi:transposase InsO family protein